MNDEDISGLIVTAIIAILSGLAFVLTGGA